MSIVRIGGLLSGRRSFPPPISVRIMMWPLFSRPSTNPAQRAGIVGGIWTKIENQILRFHRDLPPSVAAQILGGQIVFSEQRQGQWVAVIDLQQSEIQNAEVSMEK